ncbi:hypothetical protein BPY_09720 [Bifidobacterium psychraerophilum]
MVGWIRENYPSKDGNRCSVTIRWMHRIELGKARDEGKAGEMRENPRKHAEIAINACRNCDRVSLTVSDRSIL